MKRVMIAVFAVLMGTPQLAHAFCGFYVAGSNQQLLADATQVVLMRKGTRTVLSMQNNYKGPASEFAMVIPVPVVLHEGDVKTLPKDVFANIERMGAPRLVEYWEQDPCRPLPPPAPPMRMTSRPRAMHHVGGGGGDLGVKIEAQFTVGEYQIVILSAKESTGLETWLRPSIQHPQGAEPLLRPYVESGSKFFVAKVNPKKVKFVGGRADAVAAAVLLRHRRFVLPIRLGLANSGGTQDLIVNILAPGQRYEVANYPNVTIPTNFDVTDSVKTEFGEFYAALFDQTLERNPGAIVTEYAWQATSCDPCPGPVISMNDLMTLGGDVIDGGSAQIATPFGQPQDSAVVSASDATHGPARLGHGLRAHADARALWQGAQGRPRVPHRAADRRRARVRDERQQARGGRAVVERQQLPGPLRDPAPLDRTDRVQEPAPRAVGRPAERRRRADGGAGPRARVRAA